MFVFQMKCPISILNIRKIENNGKKLDLEITVDLGFRNKITIYVFLHQNQTKLKIKFVLLTL